MLWGFLDILRNLVRILVAGAVLWLLCCRAGAAAGYVVFLAIWAIVHWRPFSLPSPSGKGALRGWFINLTLPVFLAWIPLYLGLWRPYFPDDARLDDPWSAIGFLILWILFANTLMMIVFPAYSLRYLARTQEGRPTRRFLFVGGWDGTRQEHLWLDAGDYCEEECLLITSHDEHHCECYIWLPDSEPPPTGRRVKFPDINLVFGRYPRLRRVILSEDWEWLERVWEKHGYDPKTATPPDHAFPIPRPTHRDEEVAQFFNRTLPSAMGFPNGDHRSLNWKFMANYREYAWKRIFDSIPSESRLYRSWSDEAAASLRELKAKRLSPAEGALAGDHA